MKNNETCLKISENPELIKHNKCRDIILENNKFQCIECYDFRYSVLNINGESICIYLPELNGYKDDYFYYDDPIYAKNYDINSIYQFYYNNYISFCIKMTWFYFTFRTVQKAFYVVLMTDDDKQAGKCPENRIRNRVTEIPSCCCRNRSSNY